MLESQPSSAISTPKPDMAHQTGWVATVKSIPCVRAAATTEPAIATPIAAPTCRLVDATAAATPDCAGGMPDTAVCVIGGFTNPTPEPNTAYTTNSIGSGVVSDSRVNARQLIPSKIPAIISEGRVPRAASNRPENGELTAIPSAIGIVHKPVRRAENFSSCCMQFQADRPAFLPLVTAAPKYRHRKVDRSRMRANVAALLQAHQPALKPDEAARVAEVTVQIFKGMNGAFAQQNEKEGTAIAVEFKMVLTVYLSKRLRA